MNLAAVVERFTGQAGGSTPAGLFLSGAERNAPAEVEVRQ
jgi:hypothetical protein